MGPESVVVKDLINGQPTKLKLFRFILNTKTTCLTFKSMQIKNIQVKFKAGLERFKLTINHVFGNIGEQITKCKPFHENSVPEQVGIHSTMDVLLSSLAVRHRPASPLFKVTRALLGRELSEVSCRSSTVRVIFGLQSK